MGRPKEMEKRNHPLSNAISKSFWPIVGAQPTFVRDGSINESSYFFPFFGFKIRFQKSLDSLFPLASFCTHSPRLSLYLVLWLRLTHLVSDCLSDMRLWYPWEWCKAVLLSYLEKRQLEGLAIAPGTG